jgi:hypothetical protein
MREHGRSRRRLGYNSDFGVINQYGFRQPMPITPRRSLNIVKCRNRNLQHLQFLRVKDHARALPLMLMAYLAFYFDVGVPDVGQAGHSNVKDRMKGHRGGTGSRVFMFGLAQ